MRKKYYRYNVRGGLTRLRTRTALLVSALVVMVSGGSGLSLLALGTAHATPPNWNVNGNYQVDFVLGASHNPYDLTLSGQSGNHFQVAGNYPSGGPYTYGWTGTGTLSGSAVTLSVDYTLGAVGTHMDMTGTIAGNGTMSGTWTDNYGGTRNGTWATTSGVATATTVVTVNPSDMHGWGFYDDNGNGGSGSLVNGPATPPLGVGSAQLSVTASNQGYLAYDFGSPYNGTKLSTLTALGYSTFVQTGNNTIAPSLQFDVTQDPSDSSFQGRLVYEPYYNGTVVDGQWQTWNALVGKFWLSKPSKFGNNCGQATPCTLSQLLALYPNLALRNAPDAGIGFKAGSGWTVFTGNADALVVGVGSTNTTYNFEPTSQPANDKDCRNGGWQNFNAPAFASQKDCFRWVDADAHGDIRMSGPRQKIEFNVTNTRHGDGDDWHRHHDRQNSVEYWNFDYPGGLHYKAVATCVNVNPLTRDARFMFQIPAGHPGLSGLYVVAYVKEGGKHQPDLYGHAATADLATATQWCQTGVGFSPAMYTVTKGDVDVD